MARNDSDLPSRRDDALPPEDLDAAPVDPLDPDHLRSLGFEPEILALLLDDPSSPDSIPVRPLVRDPDWSPARLARGRRLEGIATFLGTPALFGFFGGEWVLNGIMVNLGLRDGLLAAFLVNRFTEIGTIYDLVRLARASDPRFPAYAFWAAFTVGMLAIFLLSVRLYARAQRLLGPEFLPDESEPQSGLEFQGPEPS